jgi:hypothetical protein
MTYYISWDKILQKYEYYVSIDSATELRTAVTVQMKPRFCAMKTLKLKENSVIFPYDKTFHCKSKFTQ